MNFNITTLPFFDQQLKRLIKKYPSLKNEYAALIADLKDHPKTGTPLGNNCYKIRLAIGSKGTGKSGGARIITYVQVVNSAVYLLSIYDKGEQASISPNELKALIKQVTE